MKTLCWLGCACVVGVVGCSGSGSLPPVGAVDASVAAPPPDLTLVFPPDPPDLAPSCGLPCQVVDCSHLSLPTTLEGVALAPNGTLPIANAVVYVPAAAPDPFTSGLSCDRCNAKVTGKPLVLQQVGSDGSFSLANVPAGDDIPLVIQIGKWRRQVTIPSVPACQITRVPASLSRLPKSHAEGDLPQMAIATGSADPMECLLLKIGIDPKEFRNAGMGGRVSMFVSPNASGLRIDNLTPKADDAKSGLYAKPQQLRSYDLVMLPCEGSEFDQSIGARNLVDYVNLGGRVFASHYSYDWLTYRDSPFNRIASPQTANMDGKGPWMGWHKNAGIGNSIVGTLVTDFVKGKAFKDWLKHSGAQSPVGLLTINDARFDMDTVDRHLAQPWVQADMAGRHDMLFTFNTPLDAPFDGMGSRLYCGRVVYSDFHVSASEANFGQPFPQACKGGPLTDQEMALAYMLFDLSSCVEPDM